MPILNELKLAKELIRFPSITPVDAGTMNFLTKKLFFVLVLFLHVKANQMQLGHLKLLKTNYLIIYWLLVVDVHPSFNYMKKAYWIPLLN